MAERLVAEGTVNVVVKDDVRVFLLSFIRHECP